MTQINWDQIHKEAIGAMKNAYAPYSKFPVGVAALVSDGRIATGCNVENASYGVGLCAECGLVSNLISTGGGRLIAVVCVDGQGNYLAPCGRCRQLLFPPVVHKDEHPVQRRLHFLPPTTLGRFGSKH